MHAAKSEKRTRATRFFTGMATQWPWKRNRRHGRKPRDEASGNIRAHSVPRAIADENRESPGRLGDRPSRIGVTLCHRVRGLAQYGAPKKAGGGREANKTAAEARPQRGQREANARPTRGQREARAKKKPNPLVQLSGPFWASGRLPSGLSLQPCTAAGQFAGRASPQARGRAADGR